MQIDLDLLFTWGAVAKKYQKDEVIFYENDMALFYYQIIEGAIKMFNINEEGKEFTQGIFYKGSSFGEPPLFIDEVYPASAIATKDTTIIKLSKEKLFLIVNEYPEISQSLLKLMATRIFNKSVSTKQIINQKPEFRIKSFLENYKKRNNFDSNGRVLIPFTRQQIADFTGLRVETVIRTLSVMKKSNKVEITNHKLYF
jgi:CRP/FNR family transcriptional regulator